MLSPIREVINGNLTTGIYLVTQHFAPATEAKLVVSRREDCRDFESRWFQFKKVPDLAIQVENGSGEMEYKWILEIGFSQPRD